MTTAMRHAMLQAGFLSTEGESSPPQESSPSGEWQVLVTDQVVSVHYGDRAHCERLAERAKLRGARVQGPSRCGVSRRS